MKPKSRRQQIVECLRTVTVVPRLQNMLAKAARVRLGDASADDARARTMASGEDYLMRPVLAGLCSLRVLADGTYSLADIEAMNDALDIAEHNRALSQSAATNLDRQPKLASLISPSEINRILETQIDNGPVEALTVAKAVHRRLISAGHTFAISSVRKEIAPIVRDWKRRHPQT